MWMKKWKLFILLLLTGFSLSYLFSCKSEEYKPKLYLFSPEVDFSFINFDIKVIEPEEVIIKEIYIKLYDDAQNQKILSSADGINRVGTTEDITFSTLASNTKYSIDFIFNYRSKNTEYKDVLIYKYEFTTLNNEYDISGSILNLLCSSDTLSFNAYFTDPQNKAKDFAIYVKDGQETLFTKKKINGLKTGANLCSFSLLPPNRNYTIVMCITFAEGDKLYNDLILDEKEIKTEGYLYEPTAEIANLNVNLNQVSFDLYLIDLLNMIDHLTLFLLDGGQTIISKQILGYDLFIGKNKNVTFKDLLPKQKYFLRVEADYHTLLEEYKNEVLLEQSFETEFFDTKPTAAITNIVLQDSMVTFEYSVTDDLNLLKECYLILLDANETKLLEKQINIGTLSKKQSEIFTKLMPNTNYKILLYAKYMYGALGEVEEGITEVSFQTEDYSFYPTASIFNVYVLDTTITIEYSVEAEYELLSSLKCNIVALDDTLIKETVLPIFKSNSIQTITINKPNSLTNFKIQLVADYSYLIYKKEKEVLTNFYYIINPKEDFDYFINNNELYIRKYKGKSKTCIIPNEIDGYKVEHIGQRAFSNSDIKTIILPKNLKSIQNSFFENCMNLTRITIPNHVTSIGEGAFYNCRNLTSIEIPDSVTTIGSDAFYNCSKLSNVYYGGTIEDWCKINCSIFRYSSNFNQFYLRNRSNEWEEVTSIKIPQGITKIGNYQFYGFKNVTSIIIPNGVTSIGDSAFSNCRNLTSIEIPNSVTSIGDSTFSFCISLTSIKISNNVTSIGNHSFYECSSLASIEIPNGVTSIGNYSFYYCRNLTSINIPDSVTSIENYSFYSCSSLTSIEIPNSVTSIGEGAFGFCNFTSIFIPATVTNMGRYVFSPYGNQLIINCEAGSIPNEWNRDWYDGNVIVNWACL